jgi:RIO-like serine/threonine protein kinase
MDYVEGITLTNWGRQKTRTETEVVPIFQHLLTGLLLLFKVGGYHGDIHTNNIMIRTNGKPVFIDCDDFEPGENSDYMKDIQWLKNLFRKNFNLKLNTTKGKMSAIEYAESLLVEVTKLSKDEK